MTARAAAALLLLVLGTPALGETYKWVDERGVVNYSNAPPPGAAARSPKTYQEVEDRLSSYAPDPALKLAAAARGPSYYEQQAEREWLQRQRLMAANPAGGRPCVAPYRGDCYEDAAIGAYYPYAVPLVVARPVRAAALVSPAPPRIANRPLPPSRTRPLQ